MLVMLASGDTYNLADKTCSHDDTLKSVLIFY